MKSFILSMAFMLVSTFAFANAEVVNSEIIKNDEMEVVVKTESSSAIVTKVKTETTKEDKKEIVAEAQKKSTINSKVQTINIDDEVRCWRICYYQNGELLFCTSWVCELDEVVIEA